DYYCCSYRSESTWVF
nr:immunoglobulin light chain junction region [Macaca mulatta]MOW31437.1 immunoglobulin light chain junction region [Macaca mulatta]MOW31964.1 immunoglobulin light chain junction region [Macaca mulatta]MOW32114.1 immunoglobulin light chain junction region [Macaca mulatta]MOW32118.1 immunoglobulin light chain junction region [Macaca mulatta]